MNTSILPTTINFHFTSACNMHCKYCFSSFSECNGGVLSLSEQKKLIQAIGSELKNKQGASAWRINFVGGEPCIHSCLNELIGEARISNLKTSIVTNGFNLVKGGLPLNYKDLDLIGLSIDSLDPITNYQIGRFVKDTTITNSDWVALVEKIATYGVKIKVNTVVSKFNHTEDLSELLYAIAPMRWKIFQAMKVQGQNDVGAKKWIIDDATFEHFIERHRHKGLHPVVEGVGVMRGSYAMISPDGRFYDSAMGWHNYSDPILQVGIQKAWSQINFDANMFSDRTNTYCEEALEND